MTSLQPVPHEAGLNTALRFAERLDAEMFRLADLGHAGVSREEIAPAFA